MINRIWTPLAAAALVAGCNPDNSASGNIDLSLPDGDTAGCASAASLAAVREDAFRRIRAAVGADRDAITALDEAAKVTITGASEVADGICGGTLVIAAPGIGDGGRAEEAIEYRAAGESGRVIVQGGEAMFDRLAGYNPRAAARPSPTPTPEPSPEPEESESAIPLDPLPPAPPTDGEGPGRVKTPPVPQEMLPVGPEDD